MKSMKTLAKLKPEAGIWMDTAPVPEIGPNDVLIKIRKTAICGTDIHICNWDEWSRNTIPVPMIIGHEFAGVIEKAGSEVVGLKEGERVSGVNRPGCFAEYLSIPAVNVFPLPDNISDDIGSLLDPLGNATHTTLSYDLVGEDVLITGAGPIGIMAVAVARHVGARFVVITDVNDYRLNLAKKMGATRVVNVTQKRVADVMPELGMREGFDVGLEMSGNMGAFRDMLDLMNYGGRVALLGIPPGEAAIDWTKVIFKGLFLKGIYGREMFETWYKMSTMLQSSLDISAIITHRFKVDDFQEAFDVMGSGMSGKVILDWEG